MSDPAAEFMTEEEYLRTEATSPVKREYVAGFVYPLHGRTLAQAGASSQHGEICVNLILALAPAARRRGCRIYQADMRVQCHTPTGRPLYFYPDVVVTCEPVEARTTSLSAPSLIAEVLSPGTRHTDLTDKLWAYTSLPSLQHYLIVDPEAWGVRIIERVVSGWEEREAGEEIELTYLGTALSLSDVFAGVD